MLALNTIRKQLWILFESKQSKYIQTYVYFTEGVCLRKLLALLHRQTVHERKKGVNFALLSVLKRYKT